MGNGIPSGKVQCHQGHQNTETNLLILHPERTHTKHGGLHTVPWSGARVGIKPEFYHKAQPGGFHRFYEGGFLGFYVGFINLKVYHNSHNQLLPYSVSVLTVLV